MSDRTIIRFKDGQMIAAENVTGLRKFEIYADGRIGVSVLTFGDGPLDFYCETQNEQEDLLQTLSKQLKPHLNPIDLIDFDLSDKKIN